MSKFTQAQETVDVIEDEEILVDLDNLEDDLGEEEEEDVSKQEDEAKSDEEDKYKLPDKFKGKSIQDIVDSYENLEREFGRKNNEVGELRKLTDQLLSLERKPEENEEEEDDSDFFDDPQKAVNKAIENNPEIKKLNETLTKSQRDAEKKVFEDSHPDWQSVMGSQEFIEWVGKSPIRAKMLVEADQNYDYQTGADLLAEFKELHPIENTDEDADTSQEEEEALKDITTETKSKSKHSRKKIYSRAQLIELRLRDPEAYAAREDEFLQAYAEKRVR